MLWPVSLLLYLSCQRRQPAPIQVINSLTSITDSLNQWEWHALIKRETRGEMFEHMDSEMSFTGPSQLAWVAVADSKTWAEYTFKSNAHDICRLIHMPNAQQRTLCLKDMLKHTCTHAHRLDSRTFIMHMQMDINSWAQTGFVKITSFTNVLPLWNEWYTVCTRRINNSKYELKLKF